MSFLIYFMFLVKYLGLLAMSKILQTNPKSVQAHKDLIMQCIDDKDESIRLRALNLLYGMVSKKTLMEIIKKLMVHISKAEGTHYRDELLSKIIEICSQNNYQFITNFEWYVSVLVELTRMEGTKHGKLIANQLLDVAIRVESVREFCVKQMAILIENMHLLGINVNLTSQSANVCEVLFAATWICGEFSTYLEDPLNIMNCMLKPFVTSMPGHIQATFVQNIFKLYTVILNNYVNNDNNLDGGKELTADILEKLKIFEISSHIEVQERSCEMLQVLKYVQKALEKGETSITSELKLLFQGELNPVGPKAQKKVPVPEGLDLDAWINDPPSQSEDDDDNASNEKQIFFKESTFGTSSKSMQGISSASGSMYHLSSSDYQNHSSQQNYEENRTSSQQSTKPVNEEELSKRREARKLETESNPYYIKPSANSQKVKMTHLNAKYTSFNHHFCCLER